MASCEVVSATPILDLEQDPPAVPRRWKSLAVGLAIGVAIGLGCAGVAIWNDQEHFLPARMASFNLLLFLPATYAALLVHEIGHAAAARVVGIGMGGIKIGLFILRKSGKRWVLELKWRKWMSGYFLPLCSPAALNRGKCAWMVAGGPLASAVLLIVAGFGTMWWVFLFFLVIALVPYATDLTRSDGARLWQLWRHPEEARAWIAILGLQMQDSQGVRPRDWSPELCDGIASLTPTAREYLVCQVLLYYRNADCESFEAAALNLERGLAAKGNLLTRQIFFQEAASYTAVRRNQPREARIWRERACHERKPEFLLSVDAAIAQSEGRYADALKLWGEARRWVEVRKLDSGMMRFAMEKWAEAEAVCRAALPQ